MVRALLIILFWLAAYVAIAAFQATLSGLSGITLSYPGYIRLTNCILAAICGAFLLWPKEGGQLVGSWNKYVGLAFFTFSVQYGARFLAIILGLQFPEYKETFGTVAGVVVYLGSYLNNILIMAAARILLNKNKQVQAQPPEDSKWGWPRLRYEWAKLRAALPDWYLTMFLLTLLALLELIPSSLMTSWLEQLILFVRLPDAIFSVYCLSWFAYALWLNFYVRRRRSLAWLGFVLVLAYAAGQLVYAANPFIARSLSDTQLGGPAEVVRSYLLTKVSGDIGDKLKKDKEDEEPDSVNRENTQLIPGETDYKDYFDNAIFAILFPMKSLLFLPAFILYLLLLGSVNGFRKVHRELTNQRKDYLSKHGILDVIGRSLEADELALIIRLPGAKRRQPSKEERVISEVWRANDAYTWWNKPRLSSLDSDPLLKRAMKEKGDEIIINDRDKEEATAAGLPKNDPLPQTLVVVPIKFHGGVIGVLRVVFRGYGKYNDGTLEQLKFMAELISPSVQDFRTVSAVDKLGPRLSRAQAGRQIAAFEQSDGQANGFQHATGKMTETLYDLLNPLLVGVRLKCGFTSVKQLHPGEGTHDDILERPGVGYYDSPEESSGDAKAANGGAPKKQRSSAGNDPPIIAQTEHGQVRIERDHLIVRTEKNTTFDLGTLFLAIPHDRDEFSHPTLAAYYLTRRAIASQTAHGIFNAARDALGLIIQDLGVNLNKETLSPAEWFTEVEAAARKAGLLWAVASEGEGQPLMGEPENIRILDSLDETESQALSKPLGCIPHLDPESTTRHVIHLKLKGDGQHLWLGVERTQFGEELNIKSPWKSFLLNLEDVAGTALARIEERRRAEDERRQEEARRLREADDEWLKIFADLNATVMHQLVNMVHNMLGIARKLEIASSDPAASNGKSPAAVEDIKTYAMLMLDVAAAYNQLIRGDGHASCDIAEAARLAERLFRFGLRKKMIDIEIVVKSGAIANVPSYVVALALASLIGNAVDAIQSHGQITVKAEPEGPDVWCQVTNNGPPIPKELIPDLFERGPKGKSGHSGWGLYLVKRSLQNYEGEVELSHSHSEETCFTLRLPKSNHPLPAIK